MLLDFGWRAFLASGADEPFWDPSLSPETPRPAGVNLVALKTISRRVSQLFKANPPEVTFWFSLGPFFVVPRGDHLLFSVPLGN